jgi:hypothetical protein
MKSLPLSEKLHQDSRGVSTVVGFIFIFAILMILLSINQAQFVPVENEEIEFQHFQDVRNDLTEVHAAISEAGQANVAQYPTVKLGTTYPPRILAVNPAPPSGILETRGPYDIEISDLDSDNNERIQTRFLRYENGYTQMEIGPIWYENSVLYLDERSNNGNIVIFENQETFIPNGSVRVTALQKDFRKSGTGKITLNIYPAETAGVDLSEMSGEVSVTIPTRLSGEFWKKEVQTHASAEYVETASAGEVNRTTFRVDIDQLRFNTVGIDSAPEAQGSARNGVGQGPEPPEDPEGPKPVEKVPSGPYAYADADNDLEYDEGETTYTASDLYDFDKNVNLVIPSDVQGGMLSNGEISITADKITTRVDYTTTNDGLSLTTKENGPIDIAGAGIDTQGGTSVSKATRATLDGVSITRTGELFVRADEISAANADFKTTNDGVIMRANEVGAIDLSDTTIDSQGETTIKKTTQATLDGVSIKRTGELFVRGDTISAANANFKTTNDGVAFEANNVGSIDISGTSIDSAGETTLTKATEAALNEVTITRTGELSVDADEISAANAEISTNNNGVSLEANGVGSIDITGTTIDSAGETTLQKATKASLDGVSITRTGELSVDADEISAANAEINTNNDGVFLEANTGPVLASGVRIDAAGDVELIANGDIEIADTGSQEARIGASGDATADFDRNSRTFYVDGVTIADGDDRLTYSPQGVKVEGTPQSGTVERS